MRDTASQTEKVLEKLNALDSVSESDVTVYDEYVGPGYAITTEGMIEATKLLARTEGILVDPVYTGKAFEGYLDRIKKGDFAGKEAVVFLQTGGSPAIFAYQNEYALDYSYSDNR